LFCSSVENMTKKAGWHSETSGGHRAHAARRGQAPKNISLWEALAGNYAWA
jgi:hypothetical protein